MECYYCKTIKNFYINVNDYKCTECGRRVPHPRIDEKDTTGYENWYGSVNFDVDTLEKISERKKEEENELEKQLQADELKYIKGYDEVKDKFNQQEFPIRDSFKKRWIQCEICGEIKQEADFTTFGGDKHVNLGQCRKCVKH